MARFRDYSYEQSKLLAVHFDAQILPGKFEHSSNPTLSTALLDFPMNAEDVQLSVTPEARSELARMLEGCTPACDCLHLMYTDSGQSRDVDGTIHEFGPRWIVGWNIAKDVAQLPFWIQCEEFSVFFPQRHLYEEVSGKALHREDGHWLFVSSDRAI